MCAHSCVERTAERMALSVCGWIPAGGGTAGGHRGEHKTCLFFSAPPSCEGSVRVLRGCPLRHYDHVSLQCRISVSQSVLRGDMSHASKGRRCVYSSQTLYPPSPLSPLDTIQLYYMSYKGPNVLVKTRDFLYMVVCPAAPPWVVTPPLVGCIRPGL